MTENFQTLVTRLTQLESRRAMLHLMLNSHKQRRASTFSNVASIGIVHTA